MKFLMFSRHLLILATLFCLNISFAIDVEGDEVDFNVSVRPILSRQCITCHGPDAESREADLRLDIRDEALAVIVPFDPESSELMSRIVSDDDDRMPPAKHGHGLNETEIALLRRWIREGANYSRHWSFVKPELPKIPQVGNPWARNAIDRFVFAKLKSVSQTPSRDEQPARLVRRVALDLTGLPPTPAMVQRFEASPTDEVYESIVDELLRSPAYGEHWAAMWLDLARYADTFGYASDNPRTIWPWRDWVIQAFNDNLPFDQFTTEQLAGDLLPNPQERQVLATAFHRNTLNNTEGGTNNEEFRVVAVKDRVSTTMSVWMGLTIRCAECHTHKYDPISQTEYYQFFDFFNQTADQDTNNDHPVKAFEPSRDRPVSLPDAIQWSTLRPIEAESTQGATLTILEDQSILADGENPDFDDYVLRYPLEPGKLTGLRMELIPDSRHGDRVGRHKNGSVAITQLQGWLEQDDKKTVIQFSQGVADHTQSGHRFDRIIAKKPDQTGWAVGHPQDGYRVPRTGVVSLKKPIHTDSDATLIIRLSHRSKWAGTNSGRVRFSRTSRNNPAEVFRFRQEGPKRVNVPVMKERGPEERRETRMMVRGSYLQPGESVTAGVPAAFHELPENAPTNRLGVAQWLLSDQNPLTARVTVNRFWARLFGLGIVETEEDFGTQGTYPSHPQLLDWLAIDFRNSGWDVKRLLKKIVLSSTYRQSSRSTELMLELDPRNRLLARGPRVRLSAEVIRDQALQVTGLLSQKKYGPPVYPPNPVKQVRSAFAGAIVWRESQGEDRYRRAIYTYLKRTSPHPLFDTFDMATREVCSLRRIRTNTPLQSFMTLNDPTFIEAANALAWKMFHSFKSGEARVAEGFRIATFQRPTDEQQEILVGLYQSSLETYQRDPTEAKLLIGSSAQANEVSDDEAAQIAALTVVANTILNLDGFLTK